LERCKLCFGISKVTIVGHFVNPATYSPAMKDPLTAVFNINVIYRYVTTAKHPVCKQ